MTNKEYIDDVLIELEDTIHGEISDRITKARIKLEKLDIVDKFKIIKDFQNYMSDEKHYFMPVSDDDIKNYIKNNY